MIMLMGPSQRLVHTDAAEPNDGDPGSEELSKTEAKSYRSIAARCIYLSSDRPDLQFAVKEACREMSVPTASSWSKLVRIAKYLKLKPRVVWKFDFQLMPAVLDVCIPMPTGDYVNALERARVAE